MCSQGGCRLKHIQLRCPVLGAVMSTDAPAVLPHPAQSGLISRCPRFTPDAKKKHVILDRHVCGKIGMLNLLHSGAIFSPSFPPAILPFDAVDLKGRKCFLTVLMLYEHAHKHTLTLTYCTTSLPFAPMHTHTHSQPLAIYLHLGFLAK